MDMWQQVRRWLRREAAEASESVHQLEQRLDRDLTERERRLTETPSEAMERLQREIAASESSFDEVRNRIGAASATAEARTELGELDRDDDGSERSPDDPDRPTGP
jgi:phage shock protein A